MQLKKERKEMISYSTHMHTRTHTLLQTILEPDYEDEGNYTSGTTGGSGSGSGTGSGFVDPTPYLRVDLKKSPQLPSIEETPPTHTATTAAYYKTIYIRKDEVSGNSYYKMDNREIHTLSRKYDGEQHVALAAKTTYRPILPLPPCRTSYVSGDIRGYWLHNRGEWQWDRRKWHIRRPHSIPKGTRLTMLIVAYSPL